MILSDDFPKCKNGPKILSRIKGFSNWVQRGLFCSAGRTDKNAVAISSHKSFLALQMSFMYTIYTFNIKYTVYYINGQMHICISRSCSWPIHSIQSVIIFFLCNSGYLYMNLYLQNADGFTGSIFCEIYVAWMSRKYIKCDFW